jgi:NAD(P)-dependent dehydrogenase (short-subunit alcohol dehydrogenase family)
MAPAAAIDLDGKVALVTGGASGLGAETARELADAGAQVMVADVDARGGEAVAAEVGGAYMTVDVSRLEENEAMVAATVERFGGIDLVYLNAGIVSGCGIGDDFDAERYRRAMSVNLDGVVYGAHAVLPALRARGGGAIVATASLAGLTGVPMDPFYAANKHAVVGLTRSLGPALAESGIRFNAVCPGYTETAIITEIRDLIIESGVPIIPAGVVAETVVRLFASDVSGECWFVQAGREPGAFRFRGIPGPRAEPAA